MSYPNSRTYSRSPQQAEHAQHPKYFGQHQVPMFIGFPESKDKENTVIRYATRKPMEISTVQPPPHQYRKSILLDVNEPTDTRKNLRSISGSWNQNLSLQDESKSESLLLKENETLRTLVQNLQTQMKFISQQREQEVANPQQERIIMDLKAENQLIIQQKNHIDSLFQDQQKYVQELEQKSSDLLQQNNHITSLCQELQEELEHLKESKNQLQQLVQQDVQKKNTAITNLQAQLDRQCIEISQMNAISVEYDLRIKSYQSRLDQQNSQIDNLQEKIKISTDQIQQQRVKIIEVEKQRDSFKRDIINLQDGLEELRRQCESLTTEKEKMTQDNEQLLQYNLKRRQEFEHLFNSLEQTQTELLNMTHLYNELEVQYASIQQEARRSLQSSIHDYQRQSEPSVQSQKSRPAFFDRV